MLGSLNMRGNLGHTVIPRFDMTEWKFANLPNLERGARAIQEARRLRIPTFYGALYGKIFRANGAELDFGLISLRVVTTVGAQFLVDAMQGLADPSLMHFHGIGSGNAAESAGDTILGTELTTLYSTANIRATGSLTEGATASVFKTVGTNTVSGAVTITEHGIFSSPSVGSGTLLDRSVFAGIGLAANDSLETTYELTFATGG
jgi:hypothetical protein